LNGDSSVYTLSQDKILQGKPVDFFFPAYKYYHTATRDVVESINIENIEVVELEFNTTNFNFDRVNFEIDIYAEEVDTILFFLKTIDDRLIPMTRQFYRKEYTYQPTVAFSANLTNNDYKSIKIVGKSKIENRSFIVGRVYASKRIEYVAEDMAAVDSFVSKFPFEKQSDTFVKLPDFYIRLHGFTLYSRLVLNGCYSAFDTIQCISQYINVFLNKYELYDVYGINKHELIKSNNLLAITSNDIGSYYSGLKKIIASLNNCHMRLSISEQDEIESPLQAIYFYNINNEITVSAIFDPTLENEIQLGDRLLSINNVSIEQLYHDFAKNVFASTPHQREIKITQKLLYMAKEAFGDSMLLVFQNNTNIYSVCLNKPNFSNKMYIPSDFKRITDNTIERYNNIIYFKPVFLDSRVIPYLYSHKTELNHCDRMIIDLRGCSAADYSFCAFFSYLISENSLIFTSGLDLLNTYSDYIVKPSQQINIKGPIVVLIDARTTCSPELMINALRKIRSDVYVIGASNTAGSAQFLLGNILPQNAILMYFEGVGKDAFGKTIDDNIGIVPDNIVHFDSFKDLFPYNDKIKRYALRYLGYSLEDNDESQY